jgi:periplasmic protein TonB
MDANKILAADLLDLVFDNRNKDYGAYDLRRTYARRIKKALLITAFLFVAVAAAFLANSAKAKHDDDQKITAVVIEAIEPEEEEPPLPEPERQPPPPEQQQVERFLEPEIVDKDVVEPPPSQDELEVAKIDNFDQEGAVDKGLVDETVLDDKKGIVEGKKDEEPKGPFVTVEVPAKFIGDWEKFLRKNLNSQTPVDNGSPAGKHSVLIRFVVDEQGNVSNIVPLTKLGYGMEEEAIRVLKKAPKWKPAIQNGYEVKAYHTQMITFEVYEDQ